MSKNDARSRPRSRFAEDVISTSLRCPVSLKRRVDAAAALRGMTVNALLVEMMEKAFPQGHGFEGELANVLTSLENFQPNVVSEENVWALQQAEAAIKELAQGVATNLEQLNKNWKE